VAVWTRRNCLSVCVCVCIVGQTFFRIWDCFLSEGSKVLFRFAMAILCMHEEAILQRAGTGPLFQLLRNMTGRLYNVNDLTKARVRRPPLTPPPRHRLCQPFFSAQPPH
jgi:hypothetical protein